ncbi:Zinc finger homeobox protein 3, partial [Ophiophagus hannah]
MSRCSQDLPEIPLQCQEGERGPGALTLFEIWIQIPEGAQLLLCCSPGHGFVLCFSLQHLQNHESGLEGEGCFYHCVLCNYSTKAKLNLIQHVRSMKHQRSESLLKLKRLQKSLPEEEDNLGQIFTIQHCRTTDTGEWPS